MGNIEVATDATENAMVATYAFPPTPVFRGIDVNAVTAPVASDLMDEPIVPEQVQIPLVILGVAPLENDAAEQLQLLRAIEAELIAADAEAVAATREDRDIRLAADRMQAEVVQAAEAARLLQVAADQAHQQEVQNSVNAAVAAAMAAHAAAPINLPFVPPPAPPPLSLSGWGGSCV